MAPAGQAVAVTSVTNSGSAGYASVMGLRNRSSLLGGGWRNGFLFLQLMD